MKRKEKIYYKKVKYFSSSYDKLISLCINPIKEKRVPPLFISGSGRNGSTLISSILNNHKRIFIPPENEIIPFTIRYWYHHPHKKWEDKVEMVFNELKKPSMWKLEGLNLKEKIKGCERKRRTINYLLNSIYLEYAKKYNKEKDIIWGDKTPSNTIYLQMMKKQFRKSKVLLLVRDPRGVISSLLDANYNYYLERLDHMVWRWKNSINKYNEIKKKTPEEILLIKYEDFVNNPNKELNQIINWLGLEYEKSLLLGKEANMELLGVERAMNHQNIRNKITSESINKWELKLDKKHRMQIENDLKKEMKILNYL